MDADFDRPQRNATLSSSSSAYPWRVKAGIAIMLLMAALAIGTFAGYRSVLQQNDLKADPVTLSEQRFQGLRAVLPQSGVVGYLSDADGPMESTRLYYLAQYALAPVVVAHDANHELVVANFASASALAQLAAANSLTVVRDFKNGVALLRRGSR